MSDSKVVDRAPKTAREKLLISATKLFRQVGYVATTVDEICSDAGVTKGAFFHHFKSKELVGAACLIEWDKYGADIDARSMSDGNVGAIVELTHFMDGIINLFADPDIYQSCLAGTIIHEVSRTSPALKDGAFRFFKNAEARFQPMLDAVCQQTGKQIDTASLATLWMATMQGSFTLCKASGDIEIVQQNLTHIKQYILICVGVGNGSTQ